MNPIPTQFQKSISFTLKNYGFDVKVYPQNYCFAFFGVFIRSVTEHDNNSQLIKEIVLG